MLAERRWTRRRTPASRPGSIGRIGTLFVFLGAAVFLVGCGDAAVVALHSPAHPSNTQAVTFKGDATGQVDRVQLSYERYTLSVSGTGEIVQTLADAETVVKTCDPSGNVSSLSCTHTMPSAFAANSLIQFTARVWDGDGTAVSETYNFAAGDYPLPNDPIPVRVKGDPVTKLDVVFIPDTDITVASFRDQLDDVIEDLYFEYDIIKFWRGAFNFYYSSQQGHYEELCNFTNPSNMANLTAIGDTVAFLHQTDLRDCRSGTRMSSEIDYDKTLVHETGHALFNLQDEYCCDTGYSPQACYPNLWSTQTACQTDAPEVGYPTSNCTQLTSDTETLPYWRIDPSGSGGCIMGPRQHRSDSNFSKACQRRITFRVGQCISGDCFPTPACP